MRLLLILLAVVSAGMIIATRDAPRHHAGWTPGVLAGEPSGDNDAASQRYYAAEARSRTSASRVRDLGYGLMAFAVTALGLLLAARVNSMRALTALRSPMRRSTVWLWALGSWCLLIVAAERWLEYTAARGDFPGWADSSVIGSVGLLVLGVLGAIAIAVVLAVSLRQVTLPVRAADISFTSARVWITTAIAIAAAGMLLLGTYSAIVGGAALVTSAHVLCFGAILAWLPAAAAPRSV
ncbi:MAG: hypothetical protein IT353_22800 [Gemmatimonadaceae bacterium]|nr:hypothetical protein [Gemmatimonadaceae bacterium]